MRVPDLLTYTIYPHCYSTEKDFLHQFYYSEKWLPIIIYCNGGL